MYGHNAGNLCHPTTVLVMLSYCLHGKGIVGILSDYCKILGGCKLREGSKGSKEGMTGKKTAISPHPVICNTLCLLKW